MVDILSRAKALGFDKDPNKYINNDGSETAEFLCLCLIKAFLGSHGLHLWLESEEYINDLKLHSVSINGGFVDSGYISVNSALKDGVERGLDMLEERLGE